jgi:hypothetical protein
MRYLVAVESMMREKLRADPGFAGLITKNPAPPLWLTLRGPRTVYDLAELAEWLPGLDKHRPKRRAEACGVGRNVALFDELRRWAYRAIRPYWGGGLDGWNAWMASCNTRGLVMNADLFGARHLEGKEVWHVARSVAKWTWRNTTSAGFSKWQSAQGRKGGLAKGLANEDKRASARLMASAGMSTREIGAELEVAQSTVVRWLRSA